MTKLIKVIGQTEVPHTISSLTEDFKKLGVKSAMTLIVHSSLSSMGYVVGGPVSVILALENILGPEGTLAMPTHSADLSDPEDWASPAVPSDWIQTIRENMPPFYPEMTPARKMGMIVDCFMHQKGTIRSHHPFVSWGARGKNANFITDNHSLSMSAGETSPLARLYDLDATVLLIGTGYSNNTAFHLSEYRCKFAEQKKCKRGAPLIKNNRVEWTWYDDIYWYGYDFEEIGMAYEKGNPELIQGVVGNAQVKMFKMRKIVDYAVDWMNKNRKLD